MKITAQEIVAEIERRIKKAHVRMDKALNKDELSYWQEHSVIAELIDLSTFIKNSK